MLPTLALLLTLVPATCAAPCNITAVISLKGAEKGLTVCLALQAEHMQTQSCWPWTGVETFNVTVAEVPEGVYDVVVRVPTWELQVSRPLLVYEAKPKKEKKR